jgi:hypothetical protein
MTILRFTNGDQETGMRFVIVCRGCAGSSP